MKTALVALLLYLCPIASFAHTSGSSLTGLDAARASRQNSSNKLPAVEYFEHAKQESALYAPPNDGRAVDIWLLPSVGFSREYALDLMKRLEEDLKLRVRISVEIPINKDVYFKDGKQIVSEALLDQIAKIKVSLTGGNRRTIYIGLADVDMNQSERTLRFVFASSILEDKVAVVSIARMKLNSQMRPEVPILTKIRLFKMAKKMVGLLYYGRERSLDHSSVMFTPIMGLDDIDMMGYDF